MQGHRQPHQSSRSRSTLTYDQFACGLVAIARKLLPGWGIRTSLSAIVEGCLLELYPKWASETTASPAALAHLKDWLKDSDMVDFLGVVHETLMPCYAAFANKEGLMEINDFLRFSRSFGISPQLVAILVLCPLFYTVAQVHAASLNKGSITSAADPLYITEQGFVEVIALCSAELAAKASQSDDMHRV